MAKVSYNSGEFAPVEAVSVSHEPIFNDNGDRLSNSYSINVRGKLLASRGSPTSSGTFITTGSECEVIAETGIGDTNWLDSLLAKRCAMANLLETDYLKLSIGTVGATNDLTCWPRVASFTVDESDNPQYWPYNITFIADNLFCGGVPMDPTGNYKLRSVSETWEFNYSEDGVSSEYGDNRVYNVTHTVSAQGMRSHGASGIIAYSGIDAARRYVQSKIGTLAQEPLTAISGLDNYTTKYNYVDVHSIDVSTANYSCTENWIYCTGAYLEQYTVEKQTSNQRSCPTVNINGTITGLGVRSLGSGTMTTSKYDNALSFWNTLYPSGLHSRAQNLTGSTLYSAPASTSVTMAPIAGTVSYNYEFQGGPTRWLTTANWENITVSNTFSEDTFAVVQILDGGEIIQNINDGGFYKAHKTSLTVDAIYPCSTGIHRLGPRFTASTSGDLQSLINAYNPLLTVSGVGYFAVESQAESWNPYDSLYNYNVTWVWNYSGSCG